MTKHDYSEYKWIRVKPYYIDPDKSWKERYADLEKHHIEETTFLIEKIRELAEILNQAEDEQK
jgi:hypothetical protein